MKILFFHRWVGVHEGGTETHIKELVAFLLSHGHDVSILTRSGKVTFENFSGLKVYRVPKIPGESEFSYESMRDPRLYFYTTGYVLLSFLKLLFLGMTGRRPDIISTHFAVEGLVARIFRFLTGVPFIFLMEGFTDLEAKAAGPADLKFGISKFDISSCFKKFHFEPIYSPIGIDLNKFEVQSPKSRVMVRKGAGLAESDFVCLTVCRLEPRKDIPTLLKAAKVVSEKGDKIKFLIVGEGVQGEELRIMNKELGIEETVIFAGRVTDEELPNYYAAGDIFVLPTLYEGFGIVYLEAMASGLPIISTTVGAVPEVVGETGVLIPPKNPKLLAEKILYLSNNRNVLETMRKKGLAKVKEKYDRKKLLSIYEKAVLEFLK